MEPAVTPNPFVLSAVIALSMLMLIMPRRYVLFPLLITACYVTLGQYILIGSAHFTMIRIIVLFGIIRVIFAGDYQGFRITLVDRAVFYWTISSIIAYTLLYGSSQAFINRMGFCFDSLGVYLLCRIYLRSLEDVVRIVRLCALLIVPLAASMVLESISGKNPFYLLGGVPEFSEVRNDSVRSQGSFRHPILMGTFGATLLPLIIALWWQRGVNKSVVILGAAAAVIIALFSGSSGAMIALLYGVFGLSCWFLRSRMGSVRWSALVAILVVQLVMNAPVWYLFARLGAIAGGTGWHRAYLIDQSIRYFHEWWLFGAKVTSHWMPTGLAIDPTKADITNQFLLQGVNGGIVTMILFILIIVRAFGIIGFSVRSPLPITTSILVWSMGASLFAHTMSFLAVSYFDQILVFWLMLIASIARAGEHTHHEQEILLTRTAQPLSRPAETHAL